MAERWRTWLVASALLFIAGAAAAWPAQGRLLSWDEVNYVRAARLGALANALERGSLAPAEFLRFARAKAQGRPAPLPPGYREESDPLLLRHLHPPLVAMLTAPVAGARSERVLRAAQMLGALALCAAIAAAFLWLAEGAASAAAWLAVAALTTWTCRLLFAALNNHGWTAVALMGAALGVAAWIERRSRGAALLACSSLALGLATLHTVAVSCLAAAAAVAWWGRRQGKIPWRALLAGAALVAGLTLLLWPGLLLKASMAKMVAYYVYLMRQGQECADSGARLPGILLAVMPLLAAALAAMALLPSRLPAPAWGPFAVLGASYVSMVAPCLMGSQYLLPALALFVPLAGLTVLRAPAAWRWPLASLLVALVAVSWVLAPAAPSDAAERRDLAWLAQALRGRSVLADGAHVLEHALGPGYALLPVTVTYDGGALTMRERGAYRELGAADLAGRLVVVRRHRKRVAGESLAVPALAACRLQKGETVLLFDCARP